MKKFSTLIGILLIATALVSCKPDYAPVGTDGFTEAQETKVAELQNVETNLMEVANSGTSVTGVSTAGSDYETNDSKSFWIKTVITVDDNYVNAETPNVKYNMNMEALTYFYKKNSTQFYTFDELEADGYTTTTTVDGKVVTIPNTTKMSSELKMKMHMKDTLVYKDSTSGTAVNSILKYDVNVTAEGDQVTFDDGSLSIDLGDGKGAIGSNEKKYVAPFFETAVTDN